MKIQDFTNGVYLVICRRLDKITTKRSKKSIVNNQYYNFNMCKYHKSYFDKFKQTCEMLNDYLIEHNKLPPFIDLSIDNNSDYRVESLLANYAGHDLNESLSHYDELYIYTRFLIDSNLDRTHFLIINSISYFDRQFFRFLADHNMEDRFLFFDNAGENLLSYKEFIES